MANDVLTELETISNLALIPPVPDISWTAKMTFHLCESPIVLTDEDYAKYYKQHSLDGHYVIIDNGAAIGRTVSDSNLVNAAIRVGADEVVVPDEMANREITYNRARIFLKTYPNMFHTLMFVPQGMDSASWHASLYELVELAREFSVGRVIIGIGKHMHARVPGGRSLLVSACQQMGLTCHLLGASDQPLEDLKVLETPNVRGYDTSLPFALAQHGFLMADKPTMVDWVTPRLEGKRPSLDFFKASGNLGKKNMFRFLNWVVNERRRTSTSTR